MWRRAVTNRNKQKGTDFENIVLAACKPHYPGAHRNPPAGSKDVGDIGLPGEERFVIEAKATARLDLPKFHREATREAANHAGPISHAVGVVVTKRHGSRVPEEQWVHMTLGDFLWLVNQ